MRDIQPICKAGPTIRRALSHLTDSPLIRTNCSHLSFRSELRNKLMQRLDATSFMAIKQFNLKPDAVPVFDIGIAHERLVASVEGIHSLTEKLLYPQPVQLIVGADPVRSSQGGACDEF